MKTIAFTIDEETLRDLDFLVEERKGSGVNRSAFIREALHDFLKRVARARRELSDALVIEANRELLAEDAKRLIADQAEL